MANLSRAEKAVQLKIQDGKKLNSDDKEIIQARLSKAGVSRAVAQSSMNAIQARQFPSGETVRMMQTTPEPASVISKMQQLARACDGGRGAQPNWSSRLGAHGLANALGPAGPHDFSFNFTQEQGGIDTDWSGNVRIEVTGDHAVAGSGRNTSVTAGGSSGGADQTNQSNQRTTGSSGSATGSVTPGESGGGGGSATVGGSTSDQNTQGRQGTGTTGGSSSGNLDTTDENWEASLTAHLSVRMSVNFGWSDAINPFMWGVHGADQITNNGEQSGSVGCGTARWVQNRGMR